MVDKSQSLVCAKCHKVLKAHDFYKSNDLEHYPLGKIDICKQCLTMHVDNWDPSTFLPILEQLDVPWIPDEWNKLLATYGRDRSKMNGTSILGRYMAKMALKQWKDYRWKDNDYLREQAENKIRTTMEAQGFGAAEIATQIERGTFPMPDKPMAPPDFADDPEAYYGQNTQAQQPSAANANDYPEEEYDLTDEDKTYLCLKWGRSYNVSEWVRLENLYKQMMESYTIETASHEDTLKLMCKTSLKANQLLDMNDVEGAQKMLKMYDTLLKAGKFSAAQVKDTDGEFITSVSELVAICESEGFIPRYYITQPNDKVDETIADIQGYLKTLVTEEMNLGNLIDTAIQQMQQAEKEDAEEPIVDNDDDIDEVNDEDIAEFLDFKSAADVEAALSEEDEE